MSLLRDGSAELSHGGQIAFSVQGDPAAPALLLNRPLGGSMKLWGGFAERLATAFRVVSFDPLGVGQSSDVPLSHSTRDMARDAIELLDQLGIQSSHVFGLSLGAMVACWIALDFPTRVRSLVLASLIPERDTLSLHGFEKLAALATDFVEPGASAEVALVHDILSAEFRAAEPERLAEIERLVRATPATRKNLATLAWAAARHSAGLEPLTSTVPVLLLFGERDVLAGGEARARLMAELPHAACETIPGAGHDISLECPGSAAEHILTFLSREP